MRKLTEKKIIIATHNPGKAQELESLMIPYEISNILATNISLPVPKETGSSFEENAFIKAFSAAKITGFPALSDDSGIAVTALNGAPGVYTADWALHNGVRHFAYAMEKLEKNLRANKDEDRSSIFISLLCIAWPDGYAEYFRGTVKGILVWPPRGKLGFGFDPVFQPDGCFCTFGEMIPYEKYKLSHRVRAFQLFAEALLKDK